MSATNNYDKKKVWCLQSYHLEIDVLVLILEVLVSYGASTKLLMQVKWHFASFSFSIFLQEKMFGIIYRNNTSVEVLDQ